MVSELRSKAMRGECFFTEQISLESGFVVGLPYPWGGDAAGSSYYMKLGQHVAV